MQKVGVLMCVSIRQTTLEGFSDEWSQNLSFMTVDYVCSEALNALYQLMPAKFPASAHQLFKD